MVWGLFVEAQKAPCDYPRPKTAANLVENVYPPALWPIFEHMEWAPYILGHQKLTLMEDGAPFHSAQVSQDWCKCNGLVKLQWPLQSPNMNPIKTLWKKNCRFPPFTSTKQWTNFRQLSLLPGMTSQVSTSISFSRPWQNECKT
ncbi:hypothetical protein O181_052703 [Austropuccinia psidii MF-1]|uniref:Tc1-like transposase DDE domain-containing protein n=1 Tax=Austropuccinia psidii MF-1 TaxID=1389203 RepID=A0A9Q3E354_9BASI|nr:hypothetical protein [Austropuccinia psidii MF-1]